MSTPVDSDNLHICNVIPQPVKKIYRNKLKTPQINQNEILKIVRQHMGRQEEKIEKQKSEQTKQKVKWMT